MREGLGGLLRDLQRPRGRGGPDGVRRGRGPGFPDPGRGPAERTDPHRVVERFSGLTPFFVLEISETLFKFHQFQNSSVAQTCMNFLFVPIYFH